MGLLSHPFAFGITRMRRSLRASSARRLNSPANTFGQSPFESNRIKIRPSRPVLPAASSRESSNRPGCTTRWRGVRTGRAIRSWTSGSNSASNPPNQDRQRLHLAVALHDGGDFDHGLREENRRAGSGRAAARGQALRSGAGSCATIHQQCGHDQASVTGQNR